MVLYKFQNHDTKILGVFIILPNPSTYVLGSLNKFPDFFRMGTFIDNTHMKL